MNILAIDTSSKYFCLSIAKDDKMALGWQRPLGKELSRLIIPTIDSALKKAGLSLRDIDCFGIGLGPGSFTGLRIGLATLKGFLFVFKKPVVGVASLEVIARGAVVKEGMICPIVDAKRSLVYAAIYRQKYARGERKSQELLITIKDLLKQIVAVRFIAPQEKTIFLGDGLPIYRGEIEKSLGKEAYFKNEDFWYPKPDSLLALVQEKINHKKFIQLDKLLPVYLYPKECQVRKM